MRSLEKYLGADFVLALSKVADISPEIALEAFQKAVCVGRAEVVKVLLSTYSYPLSVKEEALESAARTGRHGIVEEICASADWSLNVLDKAISVATNTNVLAVLRAKKIANFN
ncbi:hypothetical protein GN244_ATG18838 [Phytophthora infestans]|uniref:Uncharacterized protein n=1 Tax=Phytophthora infestans TaxID=4787 RepID=A0A833SMV4_PHYIN|nr:hypothetical protein GN244_ATG18838 [Phytophthora infestans]